MKEDTWDPCLKEWIAERTLTTMQKMAAKEVKKLKHLHTDKKGSLVLSVVVVVVEESVGMLLFSSLLSLCILISQLKHNLARNIEETLLLLCLLSPSPLFFFVLLPTPAKLLCHSLFASFCIARGILDHLPFKAMDSEL